MKTVGIILLVAGLAMTAYTGFTYVTTEKVADLGALEITKDSEHEVNWQPYTGVGLAIVGIALLLLDRKKLLTA